MSTESKSAQAAKIDRVLDVVVSLAAVPVLLGALFKLIHTPSANTWLTIGLCTEAGVFLVYALRYLAFPAEHVESFPVVAPAPPATAKLDLAGLGLAPDELTKLKEGFQKLGYTVEQLSDLGNAATATNDYIAKTKSAADELAALTGNINKLNQVYGNMLSAMSGNK